MAMISRYHGHDVDLNGLRQRFALSLAGATLSSIMGIADQLGFSTRALRVEMSALRKCTPAVLHWDLNHFVVLKSVSRKRSPSMIRRRRANLQLDEFSKHFTGVVLEVARSETFAPFRQRADAPLDALVEYDRCWPALVQVLILSAALQIAAFVMPFQMQLVVDEAMASATAICSRSSPSASARWSSSRHASRPCAAGRCGSLATC